MTDGGRPDGCEPPGTDHLGMNQPATDPGHAAIRLVLAVPHARTRSAIREALQAAGDIAVVAEAPGALQIEANVRATDADVALVDLALLPYGTAPTLAGVVRSLPERARVVTVGLHADPEFARASVRAGAAAHLMTDASPDEYRQAVRAACATKRT
jgi:DNA-binding NarL/FixJ family response regulator